MLTTAWGQNVGYDDAAAHQAELEDLYNWTVSNEDSCLQRYNANASALSS